MSAAEQLAGLVLDGGWKAAQRITHVSSSGRAFSVPYWVHDKNGKVYFLLSEGV
jgi:hypothetical protein